MQGLIPKRIKYLASLNGLNSMAQVHLGCVQLPFTSEILDYLGAELGMTRQQSNNPTRRIRKNAEIQTRSKKMDKSFGVSM